MSESNPSTGETTELLRRFASKLCSDPSYMASALTGFQQTERLDDDRLAQQLNTTPEMLVRLALCKRPDPESDQFATQVRHIATYTHSDASALANVLRHQSAVEKLRQAPVPGPAASANSLLARPATTGLLTAARDHDGSESAPVEGTKPQDTEQQE